MLTVFNSKRSLGIHVRQRNRLLFQTAPEVAARRRAIISRMEWRGVLNLAIAELHEVAYECAVVLPIAAAAALIWFACIIP